MITAAALVPVALALTVPFAFALALAMESPVKTCWECGEVLPDHKKDCKLRLSQQVHGCPPPPDDEPKPPSPGR